MYLTWPQHHTFKCQNDRENTTKLVHFRFHFSIATIEIGVSPISTWCREIIFLPISVSSQSLHLFHLPPSTRKFSKETSKSQMEAVPPVLRILKCRFTSVSIFTRFTQLIRTGARFAVAEQRSLTHCRGSRYLFYRMHSSNSAGFKVKVLLAQIRSYIDLVTACLNECE